MKKTELHVLYCSLHSPWLFWWNVTKHQLLFSRSDSLKSLSGPKSSPEKHRGVSQFLDFNISSTAQGPLRRNQTFKMFLHQFWTHLSSKMLDHSLDTTLSTATAIKSKMVNIAGTSQYLFTSQMVSIAGTSQSLVNFTSQMVNIAGTSKSLLNFILTVHWV